MAGQPSGRPPVIIDLERIRVERDRSLRSAATLKPPLTRAIPVPRAMKFGGLAIVAHELRLVDLAELQAFVEDSAGHPLAEMPKDLEGFRAAWHSAPSWPPRIGTPEGSAILASPPGRQLFVGLVARRTVDDHLAGAVGLAGPAEWAAFNRVAWGLSPREEIAGIIAPDATPGGGSDWCEDVAAICERYHMTPAQVGELTVSQYRMLASGGKCGERSRSFADKARKVIRLLAGT